MSSASQHRILTSVLRRRGVSHSAGLQLSPSQTRQKRVLDLVVASVLLIVFAPVSLLCWLWIKATSHGPVIFQQPRIGLRGRPFVLLKFRSMVTDSDRCHREYVAEWIGEGERAKGSTGEFKLCDDQRITSAGRFLRKFSLDEIPQLINVLRGEMSLVGPRPALPYELPHYREWQLQRLNVLPGLTGLWQVNGRNRVSFDRMIELDFKYIREWSLMLDIRILLSTIPVVLLGNGK